uniref:Transmembrane protein 129, E3 ubiquitin protein ligase n=1 Tax=Neolamprologus brichardi TaxID=32507 RepID=A0A3Q4GM84_NEOBR
MESPELSFTLAYIVLSVCFVFTPNEFRSAGLTVQNLFSSWLGSEDVGFIQYHVRRTSITVVVHSALPLGYYMGMCVAAPEKNLVNIYQVSDNWRAFLLLSLCLQLVSWIIVFYWSRRRWHNHPISKVLQAHVQPPFSSWGSVAVSINTEFRHIDKFATGAPGARVIVTDTWVLKVTTYHIHMALQSDCHVTVTESTQHLSPDSASPTEILTLRVDSINPAVKPFNIKYVLSRQNGTSRVKEKSNRTHCCIHQIELEPCIGCMQVPANAKLVTLCREADCQQCHCRPMWCLLCLGRWFASRLDEQTPETWLSSRVPCPTCRAKFCILDVCAVR